MGKLASVLSAGQVSVRIGQPCAVGAWLATLDPETRGEALTMMASPDWQSASLHRAFRGIGLDVAASTVARHRKGECKNCG